MTKTQAGRLLTLAYYLKTQVKELEMTCYGSCGTPACALGWSTLIWPDRFALFRDDFYSIEQNNTIHYANSEILEFYGVGYQEARELFGPNPATPKQKARQIEELVATKGWVYA